VDNRIITTPAGTGPRKVEITRDPGSNHLTLWGNIPVDDIGGSQALSIDDPAQFAADLFRTLLQRRGIVVYGHTRTKHTDLANLSTFIVTARASAGGGPIAGLVPNQPLVLATHVSAPLDQDLRVINKVSQNLHAELTLRLLGKEKGTVGTIEGGLEVVRGFLTQAGIDPSEYFFADGSGLSRLDLVTPHAVVQLLQYAASQPWAADFRSTLPVAGQDGSLANRLKDAATAGHVFAKTGSLGHVNALSGYAQTMSGDQVAFSILVNNHPLQGNGAEDLIDQMVQAIVKDTPARK
jgi:D-alanyl-D-alanine carboxypeptidase/D-alanyl-D-alanine-endopeptidase (penicillin-binding protein 4)